MLATDVTQRKPLVPVIHKICASIRPVSCYSCVTSDCLKSGLIWIYFSVFVGQWFVLFYIVQGLWTVVCFAIEKAFIYIDFDSDTRKF